MPTTSEPLAILPPNVSPNNLLGLDLTNQTITYYTAATGDPLTDEPFSASVSVFTEAFPVDGERTFSYPDLLTLLKESNSIASLVIPEGFIPDENKPAFFEALTRDSSGRPRINLIHYNGPVDERQIVLRFTHGHNLPRVIEAACQPLEEKPDTQFVDRHDSALIYYGSLGSVERTELDKLAAEARSIPRPPKKGANAADDDEEFPEAAHQMADAYAVLGWRKGGGRSASQGGLQLGGAPNKLDRLLEEAIIPTS